MVPVPVVDSLDHLNVLLAAADPDDDVRRIGHRPVTVVGAFEVERQALRPLPNGGSFNPAQVLSCRVDSKARICVRQSHYSVPARLAGTRTTRRSRRSGSPLRVGRSRVMPVSVRAASKSEPK
jgi:hypothetical protein